jgi:hypothetical protein
MRDKDTQEMRHTTATLAENETRSLVVLTFDGRKFLTDAQWETYMRRAPVRYACRTAKPKPDACEVCGMPWTLDNPPQASHCVPFGIGVRIYRLTPDLLDNSENGCAPLEGA